MNLIDLHYDYIKVNKVSALYAKWAAVGAIAAALERRVWLDNGNFGYLYPNVYVLLVGPQGNGKSSAIKVVKDYLVGTPINFGPVQITPAALIQELSERLKWYQYKGRSIPQSCVFVVASELAKFFQDFGGGSLLMELLDYYDSPGSNSPETYTIVKRTKKDSYEQLRNPSITLLGGTTPEYISLEVKNSGAGQMGLDSRIIFVVDNKFYPKLVDYKKGNPRTVIQIKNKFRDISRMIGPMQMDAPAQQLYQDFIAKLNVKLKEEFGNGTILENFYTRMDTNLQKVAMCVSAGRAIDYTITKEDLQTAIDMFEELEPLISGAYKKISIHKDDQLEQKILSGIPKSGWITEKNMLTNIERTQGVSIRKGYDYDGAILYLESTGAIESKMDANGKVYRRGAER